MRALTDAAKALRDTADQLDVLACRPQVPPAVFDLPGALTRLRNVNPDGYVAIAPPQINSHRPSEVTLDEWQVYDGKKHYKGRTLDEAVRTCELANEPRLETAEHVVAVLTGQTVDI